jgi:hypothetical protein
MSFRFVAPTWRQQQRSPQFLIADPLPSVLDRQRDPFMARRSCDPNRPRSHRSLELKESVQRRSRISLFSGLCGLNERAYFFLRN